MDRALPRPLDWRLPMRWGGIVLVVSIGAFFWSQSIGYGFNLIDFGAYWEAGERVMAGEPVFAVGATTDDATFRYSPWFAWAFAPLTLLPREAVEAGWSVLMLVSLVALLYPLLRLGFEGVLFAVFVGGMAALGVGSGNIGITMEALILWTIRGRYGPLSIAAFASLKAVPILFALAYVARREWAKAAWTVALTALLVAPMLVMDLTHYPFESGVHNGFMAVHPVVWLVVALAAIAYAAWKPRRAYSAAAVAVLVSWPRMFGVGHIGGLAIGMANDLADVDLRQTEHLRLSRAR